MLSYFNTVRLNCTFKIEKVANIISNSYKVVSLKYTSPKKKASKEKQIAN